MTHEELLHAAHEEAENARLRLRARPANVAPQEYAAVAIAFGLLALYDLVDKSAERVHRDLKDIADQLGRWK